MNSKSMNWKPSNKMSWIKTFFLATLFSLFAATGIAQDIEYAREAVGKLASEEMFGRGYVKDGHLKAAAYIAEEYERWGLEQFDDSYFQKFKIDVNTFPDDMEVGIQAKRGKKQTLETGADFIIHPCSPNLDEKLVPAFIDGTVLPSQGELISVLRKKDGSNVALVIERPEKDALDKDQWEQYNANLEVLRFVTDINAAAIIEVTDEKLSWHMSRTQCARPFIQIKKDAFQEKCHRLDIDIDAELEQNLETQNVIGYIPGTLYPDSFIVFSAHYDHLGGMGDEVYIPGANDDASGVAMMLTLAKHYSQPENRPEYSIAFMAFGAEEVGILGSKHYVDFPHFPLPNIKFLLNMDIVGTGDEGIMVVNGKVFTEEFGKLVAINEENNYLPQIKSRGKAMNSDHWFFYEAGVPSFFIYTMGGISAYHDIYDRAETLPLTEYEDLFRLLTGFVEAL